MDYDYGDQGYDHFNPDEEDELAENDTGLQSNDLNEENNLNDEKQEDNYEQTSSFSGFQNYDENDRVNDIYNDEDQEHEEEDEDDDDGYGNQSKVYNDDDEVEREEPEDSIYEREGDQDQDNQLFEENDENNINNNNADDNLEENQNAENQNDDQLPISPRLSPINDELPGSSVLDDDQNKDHDVQENAEKSELGEKAAANEEGEGDNQLIADIFGDSESEEEFEGFKKGKRVIDDEDEEGNEANAEKSLNENGEEREHNEEEQAESSNVVNESEPILPDVSSDESDDEAIRKRKVPEDFVYDFDIMMQKKKESIRRRKPKNVDFINNSDDAIAEMIQEMKQAAEDDFQLNKDGKAATRKLKLLPQIETQLRKIDLKEAFLDAGVLNVLTDWLTPLPDRSLPTLQVRESMIKILGVLKIDDVERLKASGIGKAIMYLYKHPKETKDNKKRAAALIANWSRPIFNLDSNFHSMSKEEREQRDFDHMTKTKRKLSDLGDLATPAKSKAGEERSTLRPGEKGWVPRARVPMPSTRDYVIRPRSNVEIESSRGGSKRPITRLDKHIRNFREKKKLMKSPRAVSMSIEGRKM